MNLQHFKARLVRLRVREVGVKAKRVVTRREKIKKAALCVSSKVNQRAKRFFIFHHFIPKYHLQASRLDASRSTEEGRKVTVRYHRVKPFELVCTEGLSQTDDIARSNALYMHHQEGLWILQYALFKL